MKYLIVMLLLTGCAKSIKCADLQYPQGNMLTVASDEFQDQTKAAARLMEVGGAPVYNLKDEVSGKWKDVQGQSQVNIAAMMQYGAFVEQAKNKCQGQ